MLIAICFGSNTPLNPFLLERTRATRNDLKIFCLLNSLPIPVNFVFFLDKFEKCCMFEMTSSENQDV